MVHDIQKGHCTECGLKWQINRKGQLFLDTLHPGMNPVCHRHLQELADLVNPPKKKVAVKKTKDAE